MFRICQASLTFRRTNVKSERAYQKAKLFLSFRPLLEPPFDVHSLPCRPEDARAKFGNQIRGEHEKSSTTTARPKSLTARLVDVRGKTFLSPFPGRWTQIRPGEEWASRKLRKGENLQTDLDIMCFTTWGRINDERKDDKISRLFKSDLTFF